MRIRAMLVFCVAAAALPALTQPVVVTATGPQRSIPPYFFGTNEQSTAGPNWSDGQLLNAIATMAPGNFRFPGGHNSNFWDWQNGWFLANSGQAPPGQPNSYHLQDLENAIAATGATPDYVVNLLTSDLATQLSMLHAARALGLPVTLVELGNEISLHDPAYISVYPTGTSYATVANQWVSAIKSAFPQARIAISTLTGIDWSTSDPRDQPWNTEVMTGVQNADAVVMHTYPNITKLFSVSLDGSDPETPAQQTAEQNALQDPSAVPKILGAPFDAYAELEGNIASLPAPFANGMRVWVTEYNLSKTFYAAHGTWMHGLFVGALTSLYMQDSRVEMLIPFNLCDSAVHGMVFYTDHGFQDFVNPVPTEPFAFTATGAVLHQFALAIHGMSEARALAFSPSVTVARSSGSPYPALIGWCFTNGSNRSAVILNLSGTAIPVDLSDVTMRPRQYDQLSAPPLTRITGYVTASESSAPVSGTLSLSPYSITRLQWEVRGRAVRH